MNEEVEKNLQLPEGSLQGHVCIERSRLQEQIPLHLEAKELDFFPNQQEKFHIEKFNPSDAKEKLSFNLEKSERKIIALKPLKVNVSQSQSKIHEKDISPSSSKLPSEASPIILSSENHSPLHCDNFSLSGADEENLLTRLPSQVSPFGRGSQFLRFNRANSLLEEDSSILKRRSSKPINFYNFVDGTQTDLFKLEQFSGSSNDFTINFVDCSPKKTSNVMYSTEEHKESHVVNQKDKRENLQASNIIIPNQTNSQNLLRNENQNDTNGQKRAIENSNEFNHEAGLNNTPAQSIPNQIQSLSPPDTSARVLNNQQVVIPNLRILSETEVKLYLRRNVGFFLTLWLSSLAFLLNVTNQVSYQGVFVVFYFYLAYVVIENTIGTRKAQELEAWKRRDDFFTALDALSGIFGIICVHLKLLDATSMSIQSGLPFFISTVLYTTKSNAPKSFRKQVIFWKAFSLLQVLLITARLDEIIDWEWRYVLVISWFLLGIIGIYFLACTLYLIILLLLLCCQQEQDEIGGAVQIVGFAWYVMYYGLSILGYTLVFGFSDAYKTGKSDLLKTSLWISVLLSVFLSVYTMLFFKPLVIFVKDYSLRGGFFGNTGEISIQVKKQGIEFRVEKKQNYFVKLSSTYFSPLNHQLLTKNKDNLLRIRKMLTSSKFFKSNNNSASPSDEKPITIETLKNFRQDLNESIEKISKNNSPSVKKMKFKKLSGILTERPTSNHEKNRKDSELQKSDCINFDPNLNLSADDIENIKKFDKYQQKRKGSGRDEDLCYLCYERAPNVVLMNCGHGGICYECAEISIKKKAECMECRRPIVAIHKLDINLKFSNVIKSYEVSNLTLEK